MSSADIVLKAVISEGSEVGGEVRFIDYGDSLFVGSGVPCWVNEGQDVKKIVITMMSTWNSRCDVGLGFVY